MRIKVDRVTKQYKNKMAVDRVSFEIGKGVTGLLGANGAGKTTLMRMMAGILDPTGGEIDADGIDVSSEEYRALLGYLPQDFGYYPEFTARKFMMYMSALKGLGKSSAKRKTEELLELVGLSEVADKRIGTFSGGMKQRIGIAQTFINDPKILILDEPTAGLDPKERARFRNLISQIGKTNTVLFSTHIVSDLEHIADNVLIMRDGRMLFDGEWDNSNGNLEQFYIKEMDIL
jgi:ABC-type multidrug transport system ATPase subunit